MADATESGKPGALPWWPADRDRSGEREPLTRAQIVAAAIKLIDSEGLDAFSMWRLGQELGQNVIVDNMPSAGGIRASKGAIQYLVQVHETLGPDWLTPDLYRIGASSLVNDILMQLRKERTGAYQSKDYFTID